MPTLKISPMPSRKLNSNHVVYYVHSVATKALLAKFDTDTKNAKEVEGFEQFTRTEQLELHNYIQNVRFFTDLGLAANLNRDYRFLLPEPLQEQLPTMFERANAHHIPFNPLKAALNGMFNHINTTVKRISEYEECMLLQDIGINEKNTFTAAKIEKQKETRKYSKKIFTALLGSKNCLSLYNKSADTFFAKLTNVNLTTLKNYAKGTAKPSQWSVSCALIILAQEGNTILGKIPYPVTIELILTPLKFAGKITSAKQAIILFSTFKLSGDIKKQTDSSIVTFFKS